MSDRHAPADTAAHGFRWDPAHYEAFAGHRARPFLDLTARIGAVSPRRVVDLGCGPGTMTEVLARRWPDAEVLGLDSSPEMVAAADARPDRPANLRFGSVDARTWAPEPGTDVWESTYQQVLRGPDPVPAFTSSTVMKPFVHALTVHDTERGLAGTDGALAPAFERAYAARMRAAYPRVPGTENGDEAAVLFGFRRLFLVGHRPG